MPGGIRRRERGVCPGVERHLELGSSIRAERSRACPSVRSPHHRS
jgi:hypothetical protein